MGYITPEQAEKLSKKELGNILKKLDAGKTLTAREAAVVAQATTEAAQTATSGYAKTWDALAAAVGVDLRTLSTFRKRHQKEIHERDQDLNRADGRHVIAAWILFLRERGCTGRGVNAPPDDLEDPELKKLPSESVLKRRRLKLLIERDEFAFEKERSRMLEVAHFEEALGHTLSTFRQSLDALPARCAGKLGELDVRTQARELLRDSAADLLAAKSEDDFLQIAEALVVRMLPEPDYHFRKKVIEGEVEIVKRTLRDCHYLAPREASTIPTAAKPPVPTGAAAVAEEEPDGEE